MLPFFVTIPHSGEKIPPEVTWLSDLPEEQLMRDVDRYVDQLYLPIIQELQIPHVIAKWHRYVVDLNRREDDYDEQSVQNATHKKGKFPRGLHWAVTTLNEPLITQPMSLDLHKKLVENYYRPFHAQLQNLRDLFNAKEVFHLDLHSMPSVGTDLHTDPGQKRADVVISDYHGVSSRKEFLDIVIKAYQQTGFKVAYNKPYVGGGITQMYGRPSEGHNTLQIELNRALYMDEASKQKKDLDFDNTQLKVCRAIELIYEDLKKL